MSEIAVPTICSPERHTWVSGPFYVKVAASAEEPNYYPPAGLVRIEHCTKCGLMRLPDDLRSHRSENLSQ